jgi:hypothetical protein
VRGLDYETLAAAYELRHGYDEPTPWKRIALHYGTTVHALCAAIKRLERDGLNRDANGLKPLSRVTAISEAQLKEITVARKAGNTWPAIAAALGLPTGTVQCRYHRWVRIQR